MRRRDGQPQWIAPDGKAVALVRADLGGKLGGSFNEAWLQNLLHFSPEIFPIEQIEPGFGDLIPLCRELPVVFGAGKSGALDNLYATADGGLVLVEAKLWRNPEARRTVVAQAMEYAAAIFRMSYDQLEQRVLKARGPDDVPVRSLYDIVASAPDGCDEAEFIDAVSRNLKRGRAVIAVVGDGIREDIAPLAELLQSHAGHRFTFALVELAVYEAPQPGVRLVFPSVLAQTVLIERGVIKIDGDHGALRITSSDTGYSPTSSTAPRPRAFGVSEDEFFEILEHNQPGASAALKGFMAKADQLGVYVDLKGGLSLKHASPVGQPLNLGTVRKDGHVDTGPSTWWNRMPWGRPYNSTLAACIGGTVKGMTGGTGGDEAALRTAAGKMPRLSDLIPAHEQAWLDAMEQYIRDASTAGND